MTGSRPLDDAQLDRVLAFDIPPPMSERLAERIAAEAVRADRIPVMPLTPLRTRRPWARRRFIAGFVAFNLFAVSAIAAALGSHVVEIPKLAALSTQLFQHGHTTSSAPRHVSKAKAPKRALAHVTTRVVSPSEKPDWTPPALQGVRPGWAMRADGIGLPRFVLERRRERALAISRMTRSDRLGAIARDMPDGARQARTWRPKWAFALRRDPIRPTAQDTWSIQRAKGFPRAQWRQSWGERRLKRQRRFPRWQWHMGRRGPRF